MSTVEKHELTWELESLLPHPETDAFSVLLRTYRTDLRRVADESEKLPAVGGRAENVSQWVDFLADFQSVSTRTSDFESFIGCHAAADAENKLFQQLEAQLSALGPLLSQAATNLEIALSRASDEQLLAFIQADPILSEIEFFIQDRRRNAKLRLPKPQELLASELAVDGIHAWGRLYDRVSGALRVPVMERGEIKEKSVGQVRFDSPQRDIRENNFFAANNAWAGIADTCADAINHIAGSRLTIYRHLGLKDHLVVPCRLNRMRHETLDAMWQAVEQRKACLLKYLHKKAKAFGLEKPAWYDLTAPYPMQPVAAQSDKIPYDEACDVIVRTFHEFSADLGQFAQRALQQHWVEAENRSGKRQGGFCTDFPTSKQSRIFMTYTDSADSVSTLAHELGHAYHTYVLSEQPYFLRDYPMNLAETASTFAETVLGEQRLLESESVSQQLEILDVMLSDAVAFLMNIHARFIFDDEFHKQRADGELTAARLSEMMLDAQKKAYQDGLASDGWNPGFWISKLHFYISGWPFYNFPYTFGYLLSLGLYALSAEWGEDFANNYRELLIATGCQESEDAVLSTFGYDLTSADFWNKSLDLVEQRVNRFVELTERG